MGGASLYSRFYSLKQVINLGQSQKIVLFHKMQMYKNNLSSDELQHFYQYGYVIIKNLYSRNQISVLCGIWVTVDDADLDNGRLWVIPGSHKLDIREHVLPNTKQRIPISSLCPRHG